MRHASPFLVPVGELLDRPGHSRPVTIETPVEWGVEFSTALPDPPLVARIELTAVPGGIVVRGDVELSMRSTCTRCLAETDHLHRVRVDQVAWRPGDDDEGDDPGYLLDGDVLDLEPMLRDEVLLALPVLWRCEPECPKLGESPQNDLNTAAPGQRSDSPFAVLRDLLDAGE
jgi:uncharacterized protein